MKNIETILSELGIEIPEDKKETLTKSVNENYKTIAEVEKKDEKIKSLNDKLQATNDALKAFDGIDAEGMKKQIEELNASLKAKDEEYTSRIAERDFNDMLRNAISDAKGINPKAIMALLDTEALKKSQNQKTDLEAQLKALSEAEDSKMLFNASTEKPVGNPIGSFRNNPQTQTTLDELYKGNPYYHPNH